MATMTYLATLETIKRMTSITGNVDDKFIVPQMLTSQDLKLRPVLGLQFMTELLQQLGTIQTISAATNSNPVAITTDKAHGYTTGDSVRITEATGMALDGQYTITVTSTTEFELDGIDGTTLGTYDIGSGSVLAMTEPNWNAMEYVTKAYVWWVFEESIPFIRMHFVNSGMQQQGVANASGRLGGEGGTAATEKEMRYFDNKVSNKAESYTALLIDFLACNRKLYPLWTPTCTNAPQVNDEGEVLQNSAGYRQKVGGM